MKKKKITYQDRKTIETRLKSGQSVYEIAKEIGLNPQSIYYELRIRTKRNEDGTLDYYNYDADYAQMSL